MSQIDWRRELWAFQTLVVCLSRSALQDPPDGNFIPVHDRPHAIDLVESVLEHVRGLPDPPVSRATTEQLALQYFILTEDIERANAAFNYIKESNVATRDPAFETAEELVRAGRLQEALTSLATSATAPAVGAHKRVLLLEHQGERQAALALAVEASASWPDVAPLRVEAAKHLLAAGRDDEALAHARAAFELLPGRGQRTLLARALAASEKLSEAWELLQPLANVRSAETLRLRAYLAERVQPGSTVELWRAYLRYYPKDDKARIRLAQLLFTQGLAKEAAVDAWAAFSEAAGALSIADIELCAVLQDKSGLPVAVIEQRQTELATFLRRQHPRVIESEQAYLRIWTRLRDRSALPAPDFPFLETSGAVRGVPTSEMVAIVSGAARAVALADQAYQSGSLSFESLVRLTNLSASDTLARYRRFRIPLSAPIPLTEAKATSPNTDLLLSDLELLLLAQLGLMQPFQQLIANEGNRVILFEDVRNRLLQSYAEVNPARSRQVLVDIDQLLQDVSSHAYQAPSAVASDDSRFAQQHGATYVLDGSSEMRSGWIRATEVVQWLAQEGYLAREENSTQSLQISGATRRLGDGKLVLSPAAIAEIRQSGAWPAFLEAFHGAFTLGPMALSTLRKEAEVARDELRRVEALAAVHELAGQAGVEGSLVIEARPTLEDVPAARDLTHEETRRCILEAGSWREALVDKPNRQLVSADFLAAGLFAASSPIDWLVPLQWNLESYTKRMERARSVQEQTVSFGRLLRKLEATPSYDRLLLFAETGLTDCVTAEDLVSCARTYRSFSGARPRRLLDAVERPARGDQSLRALMCRASVARIYAEALWEYGVHAEADELSIAVRELLDRADRLERDFFGTTLFTLFRFMVALASSQPRRSFALVAEDRYTVSLDTPAGRLWRAVSLWCAERRSRELALERATYHNIALLDELAPAEGPSAVAVEPLLVIANAQKAQRGPEDSTFFLDDGMAIVSWHWAHKPIEGTGVELRWSARPDDVRFMSLEAILKRGVDLLVSEPRRLRDEARGWMVPVELEGVGVTVPVPPEALLLRAPAEARPKIAQMVAWSCGPKDGRLVGHLAKIEKEPHNAELLTAYARTAAAAPWRVIARDPSELIRWGELAPEAISFPATLNDLRDILSEPPTLERSNILEALDERCTAGIWAERPDVNRLLDQSIFTPGFTPAMHFLRRRATVVGTDEATTSLARLAEPASLTVGAIVADVCLLRAAAEQGTRVVRDGTEVAVRDLWADSVAALILALQAEPPDGSIGQMEQHLLRTCAWVVERLAIRQSLPAREGLWLVYRLFQWLLTCVEHDGLVELRDAAHTVKRNTAELPEVLDPARFGRERFDIRLASVLHAVYQAPAVAKSLNNDQASAKVEVLWSDHLGTAIAGVAKRPPTAEEQRLRAFAAPESSLAWTLPVIAVPDLARWILLLFDRDRLIGLPKAAVREAVSSAVNREVEIGASQRAVLEDIAVNLAIQRREVVEAADLPTLVAAVRAMEERERTPIAVFVMLCGLCAAGEASLLPELRKRSIVADERRRRLSIFLSLIEPERLEDEIRALTLEAGEQHLELADALADVCENGSLEYVTQAEAVVMQIEPERADILERVRTRRSNLEQAASARSADPKRGSTKRSRRGRRRK